MSLLNVRNRYTNTCLAVQRMNNVLKEKWLNQTGSRSMLNAADDMKYKNCINLMA